MPVTQYIITLSRSSSRLSTFSGWPSQSIQAQNFSTIHASLTHGRIDQSVAQCLRPGGLLLGIAGAPLSVLGQRGQCPLLLRSWIRHRFSRGPTDRHVQVNGRAVAAVSPYLRGHSRAPVPALGAVAVVAKAQHQRLPGLGDPLDAPPGAGGLAGESIPRQRRTDDMEGVLGATAVSRRIGQRLDHLVKLHDRARPAVGDHQREGVVVRRPLMDEMNVQPVDLGDELVKAVERGLARPPVVVVGPVAGQVAGVPQRNALAPVVHAFGFWPTGAR